MPSVEKISMVNKDPMRIRHGWCGVNRVVSTNVKSGTQVAELGLLLNDVDPVV
jgi:hypothetical protein